MTRTSSPNAVTSKKPRAKKAAAPADTWLIAKGGKLVPA
jgi:hypothetical protein